MPSQPHRDSPDCRWPIFCAALGGGALLWKVPPAPGWGDAGEIGAAAQVLGVAHPTGFPLDLLFLRTAAFVPFGSVAFRQNLAVALVSVAALGVWARVAQRLAWCARPSERAAAAAACVATAGLLGWPTFVQSAHTVEVYSTGLLITGLGVVWLWQPKPWPRVAWLFGLSLSAHVAARLALLPVLGKAWLESRPAPARPALKRAAVGLGAVLWSALLVVYLPLASLREPAVDWGDPETLGRFWEHLSAARIRTAYAGEMGAGAMDATAILGSHLVELWPWILLSLVGWVALGRAHKALAALAAALLVLDVGYAVFINPMGAAERQVGHLAGAVVACMGGVGSASLIARVHNERVGRLLCAAVAACAAAWVIAAATEWPNEPWAGEELWGSGGAVRDVPARAVVLCETDDACANGWFARHAEGIRPDVSVVPAQHLWEPTLRQRAFAQWPGLEAWQHRRPREPQARQQMARAAVATLLRSEARSQVLLESTRIATSALGRVALEPSVPGLPFLRVRDGGVAEIEPAPVLEHLGRRVGARFGRRGPSTERVQAAWSRAYGNLARARLVAEDPLAAISLWAEAVRIAPTRTVAWSNLGVAHARSGNLSAAIEATRHALTLDPLHPTAWVNLVRFLAASQQRQAAQAAYKAAREAGIEDPRFEALGAQLGAN